jgi:hypothetical protein
MEDDMKNYIKYKLMGGNKKLECCVVPHIFQCQADRKRAAEVIRNVASKLTSVLSHCILQQRCNSNFYSNIHLS